MNANQRTQQTWLEDIFKEYVMVGVGVGQYIKKKMSRKFEQYLSFSLTLEQHNLPHIYLTVYLYVLPWCKCSLPLTGVGLAEGWWGQPPEYGVTDSAVTVQEGSTAKLPCVVYHLNDKSVSILWLVKFFFFFYLSTFIIFFIFFLWCVSLPGSFFLSFFHSCS